MKFNKLTAAAALVSVASLYGCSEGDVTTIDIDSVVGGGNGPVTGPVAGATSNCPEWSIARPQITLPDGSVSDVCALPTRILENRQLTNDTIWKLQGATVVGNGNQQMSATAGTLESGDAVLDVTLSIQAGTQIQAATGTFANLLITRGSKIDARGTAAAPIVFSSDDADLVGSGEWGGLILHGYAYHNECFTAVATPASVCNVDSEGNSGFSGGFDNEDSSGILQYVVVTEGGFEFSPGNEINGISFVAVGSGTTVEFIQVDNNADDGVEFYGGSVNVKNVVITGAGDDSVDWDEGYQGNLQFVLVRQTDNSGGNTIEADTEGTEFFDSAPFIMNATFLSQGNRVHRLKESTGGFIVNSIVTGGDECFRIQGQNTVDNIGTSLVYENVIADCTALVSANSETTAAAAVASNFNLITTPAAVDATTYASANTSATLPAAFDLAPFARTGTAAADLTDNRTADTDFLEATNYIGAVAPGTAAADAWFAGWTLEGTL